MTFRIVCFLASLVFHAPFLPAAEAPRALPVDPSVITPEEEERPLIEEEGDPAVVEPAEVTPLPAGEVILPKREKSPASDGPDLENVPSRENAVRLQIFLDQAGFGPGVIDGKPGRFTMLAVNAWNESRGHPENDLGPVMAAARRDVRRPFAMAVLPESAREWVNPNLSRKRSEQARAKRMAYRSYGEFLSERFHTDVDFLIELNDASRVYGLRPGGSLVVPHVNPFRIETLSGKRFDPEEVLNSRHMVIDTKVNQVRIFEATPTALAVTDPDAPVAIEANRALVASFPITAGQPQFIRYGTWEMKNAVPFPYWRYDQTFLDTGRRSDEALNIPPGPNSPVGVIWMGLSVSGIGVHGTDSPETIGRSRSAGCIRMSNWNAARLPDFIRPGATVEIR
jgi:lipoprotein-anchoring transpeptidase ErfK/SrfK